MEVEIKNGRVNFINGNIDSLDETLLFLNNLDEYRRVSEINASTVNVLIDDEGREMFTTKNKIQLWETPEPVCLEDGEADIFTADFEFGRHNVFGCPTNAKIIPQPVIEGYGHKHSFSMLNYRHRRIPAMVLD